MSTTALAPIEYSEPAYAPLSDIEIWPAIQDIIEDQADRDSWLDSPHVRLNLHTPREVLDEPSRYKAEFGELKIMLEQLRAGIFA